MSSENGADYALVHGRNFAGGAPIAIHNITTVGVNRLAVDALIGGAAGAYAQGDFDSTAQDETVATAIWARSALTGLDSSAAVNNRNVPIQARNFNVIADVDAALVGATSNSRGAIAVGGAGAAVWRMAGGTADPGSADTAWTDTLPARKDAWKASSVGRRFYVCHQTPTTEVTAQATFVSTTPTFLLRQLASTVSVILRSISIFVTRATTAPVDFLFGIDTGDRFSAGGTSVARQNPNEASAVASAVTDFLINATATAAGAGIRYLAPGRIQAGDGQRIQINFEDGVLIGTTAAGLMYLFDSAGTTAPECYFVWEWEEVV